MKRAIVWATLSLALILLASVTANALEDSTEREDSTEVKNGAESSTSRTRYRRALTHHRHHDDDDDDDEERRYAGRPFIRRRRPRPSGSPKFSSHPLSSWLCRFFVVLDTVKRSSQNRRNWQWRDVLCQDIPTKVQLSCSIWRHNKHLRFLEPLWTWRMRA